MIPSQCPGPHFRRAGALEPPTCSRIRASRFQIWMCAGPKMFTGMFKIRGADICRARQRVATSACCSWHYGDAGGFDSHSARGRNFPDCAQRIRHKQFGERDFRILSRLSHSVSRRSHTKRIPSAFCVYLAPIATYSRQRPTLSTGKGHVSQRSLVWENFSPTQARHPSQESAQKKPRPRFLVAVAGKSKFLKT